MPVGPTPGSRTISHPILVGLGIATLATLSITGPWISPSHDSVYHLHGPAWPVFCAVGLDLCLVWAVTAGILQAARRWKAGFRWVWSVLLACLPMVILRNWSSLTSITVPRGALLGTILVPSVVMLVAGLGWWGAGRLFDPIQELAATMLGSCAMLGFLILAQLMWFGWRARNVNGMLAQHHPATGEVTAQPHRVIWILLDELSYQQVYERRAAGLKLPEFDRLADEATVFTDTVPAGESTAQVIPSLMTGIQVDELKTSIDGKLVAVHDRRSGAWLPFDPRQTVFGDALDKGYRTAVAGWYNPYCRILAPVLDNCYWTSRLPYHGHIYADRPVWTNVAGPVLGFAQSGWRDLMHRGETTSLDQDRSQMHLEDYRDLLAAGDADLADPAMGFVFLHLPIPHPGGIYDSRHHVYSTAGRSYIDNLALADRYLTHVREALESRGEWESSTVVVMGDHSWRTKLIWLESPDWTAEDQVASHGGEFDDRPAYLVKLPGQKAGTRIDVPFAATRTRSLLDEMLAGKVVTVDDLTAWVQRGDNATKKPSSYKADVDDPAEKRTDRHEN